MTRESAGLELRGYSFWGGTDPQAQADEETLSGIAYRPTLIIGLGGTGLTVVQKLRRRIRKYFRQEDQGAFQFLVFDTMPQKRVEKLEWLPSREFHYLGGVDGDGLIRHLHRWPLLEAWWPHKDYLPGYISDGAGAVRCVGRLALFHKINEIHGALQRAVSNSVEVSKGGLTDRPTIGAKAKVYIVSSLCGGTGSGMFLDMAYLARSALQELGLEVSVTGALVMPEAFYGINRSPGQQSWWRANAYAALKELDHFMGKKRFYTQYAPFTVVDQTKRPFNICYLVGSVNERGHTLQDYDGVTEMIAEEVFTEIVSPVGELAVAIFDDIESVQQRSRDGKPAAYSSFSIASLVFLAADLAAYCAARNHIRFVDKVLLAAQPEIEVEAAQLVEQFVTSQRLRETGFDELIDFLSTDDDGSPLGGLEVYTDEMEVPRDEAHDAMASIEEDRRSLLAEHAATMERRRQEKLADVRTALREELTNIIVDPGGGLVTALRFLEVLAAQLEIYRSQEMKEEERQWIGNVSEAGKLLTEPGEDTDLAFAKLLIDEALASHFFVRSRRMESAIAEYAAACTSAVRAQFELERRGQGSKLYADLAQDVGITSRQIEVALATLRSEQNQIRRQAESFVRNSRFMSGEYALDMGVVDEEQLDALYREYELPLDTRVDCSDAFQLFLPHFRKSRRKETLGLDDFVRREGLSLSKGLYDFLEQRFGGAFEALDVLSVMRIVADDQFLEVYMANLFDRAVPFWNWDETELSGGTVSVRSINALGIGDKAWAGEVMEHLQQEFTPVDTKDQYAITMMRTSHGLPLHALRALARQGKYHSAYRTFMDLWREEERDKNTVRPPHTSKVLENSVPDIYPREYMENYELFAVGTVMDLIYERNNWYYVQPIQVPGERTKDPYQLQQGLRPALEVFVHHPEGIRAVRQRVQDRSVAEGKDEITEVLRKGRDDFYHKSQSPGTNKDLYADMKGWIEQYCQRHGITLPPEPSS